MVAIKMLTEASAGFDV